MKNANTKQTLLEAGKQLIWEKGYTATGIQDVLQAANVPKGSFYHYFESKDSFVFAALESYMQEYYDHVGHYLEDETLTPLIRLRRFFEAAGDWFESQPSYRGCMIGNLSQELSACNEVFRFRLQSLFEQLRSHILRCLQRAQQNGELSAELSADQLADFCLNGLHGALLRMKVNQNPAPLHAFLAILFERVLTR
jgi:TetR/AcrR family transcriptional repressor of nem operon